MSWKETVKCEHCEKETPAGDFARCPDCGMNWKCPKCNKWNRVEKWAGPMFTPEVINKCTMKWWEYWYLKLFKKPTVVDKENSLAFYRWRDKIYVMEATTG